MFMLVSLLGLVVLATGMDIPRNIQTEYYATATLMCEDNMNDAVGNIRVKDIFWIFPDGSLNTGSDIMTRDSEKYILNSPALPYNLTIKNVADDDFGVYYCVATMDYSSVSAPTKEEKMLVFYKGLNVEGPSYEKLIEEYKTNAMIGGIAAAVVFVVVGGSCLFYHFRYDRKNDESDGDEDPKGHTSHNYDNKGLDIQESARL